MDYLDAQIFGTDPEPREAIDPGEAEYEADRAARPFYHHGEKRPPWAKLNPHAQHSWNKAASIPNNFLTPTS